MIHADCKSQCVRQPLLQCTRIGIFCCIGIALRLALWLATGARPTFIAPAAPWTLYIGGLCGFAILSTATLAFPNLGAAWSIAMVVLGQGIAALAIDHFGLLGMPRDPVTAMRVVGVALVAAGVAVMRI